MFCNKPIVIHFSKVTCACHPIHYRHFTIHEETLRSKPAPRVPFQKRVVLMKSNASTPWFATCTLQPSWRSCLWGTRWLIKLSSTRSIDSLYFWWGISGREERAGVEEFVTDTEFLASFCVKLRQIFVSGTLLWADWCRFRLAMSWGIAFCDSI